MNKIFLPVSIICCFGSETSFGSQIRCTFCVSFPGWAGGGISFPDQYWNEIATLRSRSKYSATDDEVIKFYTTTWLGFGQDPSELYESLLVLNTVLEDVFCHTTVSRGERLLWKKFLS